MDKTEDKDAGESALGEGPTLGLRYASAIPKLYYASESFGMLGKNTVSWAPLFQIQIQKIWGSTRKLQF